MKLKPSAVRASVVLAGVFPFRTEPSSSRNRRRGEAMRPNKLLLGMGAFLLLAGCNNFPKWGGTRAPDVGLPRESPQAAALVQQLNENSQRIQALECRNLSIDAKVRLQPNIGLEGQMSCQKGKNFRMVATFMGKQAVDMGSNDQEFWYWISRAEPPYLVHCSYQDLPSVAAAGRMPFPFQPEWIMETFGMSDYDPSSKYEVNGNNPKTIDLIQQTVSSQGQPVRKVVVFSRPTSTSTRPQVIAYLLQDPNGKEICSAHITQTQYDQKTGATVPRQVTLSWPAEHMEMRMTLDRIQVNNPVDRDRAAALFTRPHLANVPTYDLARGPETAVGAVQQTGGFMK
jgi:hypothetical protein